MKRPTAQDVGKRAGVSRSTVSFVLNNVPGMRIKEETRQRVLQAAGDLDYHPDATARRMVSGKTRVAGFVLPQTPDQAFADRFLPQVLNGLTQAAIVRGYHLLLEPVPPSESPGAYLSLVQERHVDGIILSGPRFDDRDLPTLHAGGVPVVIIGRLPGTSIPFVDVDNVGGAAQAVRHLLELGHRRIAMITNATLDYTASSDRLTGYREALKQAQIPFDEGLVRIGAFTPASGEQAMDALLDMPQRPSAVFVASDTVALGAYRAVRRRNMTIPDHLSIVGFDDIPAAEIVEPNLTTIRLPAYGIGWAAMELLTHLIESPSDVRERSIELDTEIVVRQSTSPVLP
jgi:DNA-binding LacI/PurR family transcriptional regulator